MAKNIIQNGLNLASENREQHELVSIMYHALYETDAELAAMPDEEQPYAVSVNNFKAQLDHIEAAGRKIVNPAELKSAFQPGVLLTFDDGHESFHRYALPILAERNLSAIFFITPQLVESRSDFCEWSQLKTMAAAGMAIQSHGLSHRFISDISDHEINDELQTSKRMIEDACDTSVYALSFPGGRYHERALEIASYQGYTQCYTSDIGVFTRDHFDNQHPLPRLAIKRNTTLAIFDQMITAKRRWLYKAKAMATGKKQAKRLLGNRGYHHLYQAVSTIKPKKP